MALPALAHGDAVQMHRMRLHYTFTGQPLLSQQGNLQGRVFGSSA